ncbi:P-loop containing nucleoside triphosphate hydrolase [Fusarium oxysporum f. sp. vasinfectum]|nr:P-loop containing nucleoside triphosphate hydrolase [Fusarium oxysporum f. sp. vasinfectum]
MISAMGESARSISSDIKDSDSCCQYQFSAGAKLLWVNGPAGFGKTLLCAHVVEYPSSTLDTLVAHFFFTSDHESREDPFLALRLWISQIVSRHEGAFEYVRQKWESDSDPVATRSTVISLFTQLLHDIPGCTFVADGLDECTSLNNTNNSTAKFLHDVANAIAGTNARLLVLSRDEPEIRYALINDMRESFVEYRIMPKDVRSRNCRLLPIHCRQETPDKSDDIRSTLSEAMTN